MKLSICVTTIPLLSLAATAEIPQKLVVEGLPPIPPRIKADPGRYLEFRAAYLTDWHPSKAAQIEKPLFVILELNHPRVPGTEPEQMLKAIRSHGGTVWYLMAKDEGHGFQKKRNANFMFQSIVLFLEEYLLNR